MMYLTKHQTQADYDTIKDNLPKPQVALIEETMSVAYQPYVPIPHHDYIEIGGIKWATMNIGANSVTDYGFYFQWGDTQGYTAAQVGIGSGQKYFGWADYKYGNGTSSPGSTKYNSTDSKTTLEESDDAVVAAWGNGWRMPTISEFIALEEAVTTTWTSDYQGSGIAGLICIDKTDSSKVLFFPAGGSYSDGTINNIGDNGFYWASSLNSFITNTGRSFSFSDDYTYTEDSGDRCFGYSIRGVLDDSNS